MYGPFHRLRSPTQSDAVAKQQQESAEVWGRARQNSDIPQVQAYIGPLPNETDGIEFLTAVAPDTGTVHARWTGPREGVRIMEDFARISVVISKNTQIPVPVDATAEKAEEYETIEDQQLQIA